MIIDDSHQEKLTAKGLLSYELKLSVDGMPSPQTESWWKQLNQTIYHWAITQQQTDYSVSRTKSFANPQSDAVWKQEEIYRTIWMLS